MTLTLDRPPARQRRPWWHPRPGELRLFAQIVAIGAPVAFAVGALVGIFSNVPGPAPPGRTPATAVDTPSPEAPPVTWTSNRPILASAPEVRAPQRTRAISSTPTGRGPAPPVVLTTRTVTVRSSATSATATSSSTTTAIETPGGPAREGTSDKGNPGGLDETTRPPE